MMDKIKWFMQVLVIISAGLLAYPVAPIAVLFATIGEPRAGSYGTGACWCRGTLPWIFTWLETPDEPLPGGAYEPAVAIWYVKYPWRIAALLWLWRNTAHTVRNYYGKSIASRADARPRLEKKFGFIKIKWGYQAVFASPPDVDGRAPLLEVPVFTIRLSTQE